MQNPEVLAALQGKMDSMIGIPSGYIQKYVLDERLAHDICTRSLVRRKRLMSKENIEYNVFGLVKLQTTYSCT